MNRVAISDLYLPICISGSMLKSVVITILVHASLHQIQTVFSRVSENCSNFSFSKYIYIQKKDAKFNSKKLFKLIFVLQAKSRAIVDNVPIYESVFDALYATINLKQLKEKMKWLRI